MGHHQQVIPNQHYWGPMSPLVGVYCQTYSHQKLQPHPQVDGNMLWVFFVDHTLAHPLNCRDGVVARLSA